MFPCSVVKNNLKNCPLFRIIPNIHIVDKKLFSPKRMCLLRKKQRSRQSDRKGLILIPLICNKSINL